MRLATQILLATCITSAICMGQTPKDKYVVGNVMEAQVHEPTPGEDPNVLRYDVTLVIGNTEYVVLYAPPYGQKTVEYRLGSDGLFLVEKDTIVFHDMQGRRQEVPILSRRSTAGKSKPE